MITIETTTLDGNTAKDLALSEGIPQRLKDEAQFLCKCALYEWPLSGVCDGRYVWNLDEHGGYRLGPHINSTAVVPVTEQRNEDKKVEKHMREKRKHMWEEEFHKRNMAKASVLTEQEILCFPI